MTQTTSTKFYIVITTATDWCDIIPLRESRHITVGRSGKNDVVITDDRTSRKHCVIRFRKGKWIVQDLDSMNGTYLNGGRIEGRATLSPADTISIATAKIKFTDNISEIEESADSVEPKLPADESTIMLSRENDPTDLQN
jgi:pSer/pThr/pTyr-binding forkhead associated (FHA) protein